MRPYAWVWFDALPSFVLYTLLRPTSKGMGHYLIGLLAGICADAGVTTLNDVCDIRTDRISTEKSRNQRALVLGIISVRAALIQVVFFLVLGLALATFVGRLFGLTVGCAMILGVAYSIRPLRLSGRPLTAQPFWVVFGLNFYLGVAALAGRLYTKEALLWFGGTAFFMALGENLAKDLRDWENDTLAGKKTTVVSIGPRLASAASLAGGATGSGLYLSLIWLSHDLGVWTQVLCSLLILAWLMRLGLLVRDLSRKYDKEAARWMHVGYIRTYLALNVLLAMGLHFRAVTRFLQSLTGEYL